MKITPAVQKHLNIIGKGVREVNGKLTYAKDGQPVPPSLTKAVLERYKKRNLVREDDGMFLPVAAV